MDRALIEARIVELLGARSPMSSMCPSEVARALSPSEWRPLMDAVREAAATLAKRGALRITQGEATVDPEAVLARKVRGPIRLRSV